MNDNHQNNGFHYTYSARQQEEIKQIRRKYLPESETEDKMARLRRLDRGVMQKGTTVSLIVGILGALILGTGMCLAMEVLAEGLIFMILGIGIGLVGMTLIAVAYPLYRYVVAQEKKRITPEIMRLTDELMK